MLQAEVPDLAIELIARYQPVAADLRFIRSSMEIAYGFLRFGRYAYDIVDVLETIGTNTDCDKAAILEAATTVREMIRMSVQALHSRPGRYCRAVRNGSYDRHAVQKVSTQDHQIKCRICKCSRRCQMLRFSALDIEIPRTYFGQRVLRWRLSSLHGRWRI